MISRDFCREQITRLYQFKGYPKLNFERDNAIEVKAALKELVDSLHECAETEEKARRVIDSFCQDSQLRECPLPPEIRRAFYAQKASAAKEYSTPKPTRCVACSDTGFKRKTFERDGEKYDFAVPCACRESKPVERAAAR